MTDKRGPTLESIMAQIDDVQREALGLIEHLQGERDELLEVVKAQHEAIDSLFAQLILLTREHTPNALFFPSQSGQPWEACERGAAAIRKAELRRRTKDARDRANT